jgi:hypothetical protein
MDQGQTFARALPAKRHRYHEQRFTVIYQGKLTVLVDLTTNHANRFDFLFLFFLLRRSFSFFALYRSIKTTREDTRVRPTTHRVRKARPVKWKFWLGNRQRSRSNRTTCTRERLANR